MALQNSMFRLTIKNKLQTNENMDNKSNVIIYQNGEIELKVSFNKETVWLRQDEIALLFEKNRTVITKHINRILKDNEVKEKCNVQKMHFANSDKPVKLYSLDIILAVGYRTNSAKAIKFRQWATNVLKDYILKGYAINGERITYQRFKSLEDDVSDLKNKINKLHKVVENNDIKHKQGIFYDGQTFDAYIFVSNLIKSARESIVLIDNYVDETVLTLFSKNQKIEVTIFTKNISNQLKLDLKKYNNQYKPINIKLFVSAHDRFLIIDEKEIYHLGASLKDLGKKWFAFSRFDMNAIEILNKLKK